MNRFRRSFWMPAFALVILVAFAETQAFGCCKTAAQVMGFVRLFTTPAASASNPGEHACCAHAAASAVSPLPAKAAAPVSHPGPCRGDKGCCLKGAQDNRVALTSPPTSPVTAMAPAAWLPQETPALPHLDGLPAIPANTGPPVYLATRRLLI